MKVASKSCIWLAGGLCNKLPEAVQTLSILHDIN